ncbi:S-layer homology domain-containing protein [Bacillus dakarensis]|uniref:S-layer homology domain-containing protein n=1 Tax=Robertmurraya dakarensis TaxID=1926278 RepID=UPI0009818ADF|nr:S-layer homology domain-containing protein [Bacillus dakarensis]
MKKNTKLNKFMAGSVTAALVASAVAPAVSAAENNFQDIVALDAEAQAAINALADAGVVKGYDNGTKFDPWQNVKRGQVALMLSRVAELGLDSKADTDTNFTDVTGDIELIGAVEALVNEEIASGYTDGTFKPYAQISRQHMAKLIVKAFDLKLNEDVEVNITDLDEATTEMAEYIKILASHGITTQTEFNPQAPVSRYAFTLFMTRAMEAVNTPEVPEIVESEITNIDVDTTTTVEVQFNQAVEAFDRNDVVIEDEDEDRIFVKSVELAEDGKSASLELYDALKDETSYDFTINAGEEELSYTLDFVLGEVSEILASSKTIDPSKDYEIEYTVLTDTGVDVTEETDVTFNDDRSDVDTSTGVIVANDLEDGQSVFVEIVAGDVKSKRIKITANDGEATEFSAYSVVSEPVGDLDAWNADDFEADHDIAIGQNGLSLDVLFLDQYGEEAAETIKFESLSPSILVVDEATGELTARKVGTADVKVTMGDVTKVVKIDVVAEAKFDALEIRNDEGDAITNLAINPDVDENETVTVQLVDQYGEDFSASEEDLTVEVKGDSVEVDQEGEGRTTTSGALVLNLTAVDGETGKTTITVKNEDGKIVETLEVSIEEAGEIADYKLEGLKEIDLYGSSDDDEDTVSETTLQVFPVDEDDVKTAGAVEAEYVVVDEDGTEIDSATGTSVSLGFGSELAVTETGTYTLKVTVGALEVINTEFEVVDTEAAYELTQTEDEIVVDNTTNLFAEIQAALEITQDGDTVDSSNITSFSVVSDKKAVIADSADASFTLDDENAAEVVLSEGTATLFVDEVVINGKTVEVDYQFDVTVEDVFAPAAQSMVIADQNSNSTLDAGETVTITFTEALSGESVAAVKAALEGMEKFGEGAIAVTEDNKTFVITAGESASISTTEGGVRFTTDIVNIIKDGNGNAAKEEVFFTVAK